MEIKISKDKLDLLKNVIFDSIGVDKNNSFQSRMGDEYQYVEFLTPYTRKNVIARLYETLDLIVVNDEKFYELISMYVGSSKFYDLIKDEIIKKVYKKFTQRYPRFYKDEIRNIKYVSDEEFQKKKYQ